MIRSEGSNLPNKKSAALDKHLQDIYRQYKHNLINAMTFVKLSSLNSLPTSRIMGKTRFYSIVASIKNKYKRIEKKIKENVFF